MRAPDLVRVMELFYPVIQMMYTGPRENYDEDRKKNCLHTPVSVVDVTGSEELAASKKGRAAFQRPTDYQHERGVNTSWLPRRTSIAEASSSSAPPR